MPSYSYTVSDGQHAVLEQKDAYHSLAIGPILWRLVDGYFFYKSSKEDIHTLFPNGNTVSSVLDSSVEST